MTPNGRRPTASASSDRLARLCLLHVLNEQALWEMASLSFWQRFIASDTGSIVWPPADATGIAAPRIQKDAFALRAWFHSAVLTGWKRICDGDRISFPVGSTDCEYFALMGLMRERHGWNAYGPELSEWTTTTTTTTATTTSDATVPLPAVLLIKNARALRTSRMRAAAAAGKQQIDTLDLSVSYKLCTPDERRTSVLLNVAQMRERLRCYRASGHEDDMDYAVSYADYAESVISQIHAADNHRTSSVADPESRPIQCSVFDMQPFDTASSTPIVQHRRPRIISPSPFRSSLFNFSTSTDNASSSPACPPSITATRCRLECKRLLASGNRDRLTAWLRTLPADQLEREVHFIDALSSRNQKNLTPKSGEQPQRMWLRMPMLSSMHDRKQPIRYRRRRLISVRPVNATNAIPTQRPRVRHRCGGSSISNRHSAFSGPRLSAGTRTDQTENGSHLPETAARLTFTPQRTLRSSRMMLQTPLPTVIELPSSTESNETQRRRRNGQQHDENNPRPNVSSASVRPGA